ncbi:AAA domain-containing protein [Mariniblastus fucicola]|uniref:DNA helicase n=1 Tax=Mariniblastus fucicola TaxID=980251 RepID=A0A5B9PNR7_9BACT|nr:AAA domain-containing protein [Mariniblastus fucicola]QEG24191.1 ATP-dependent RecD-like DNA helicase [Mariniblastus fucicola]
MSRRRARLPSVEIESHFVNMVECIALESKAEVARMAERRKRTGAENVERSGETIVDLVIQDHKNGLGGRHLVQFCRRNRNRPMPWHKLKVGSPVVVSNFGDDGGESLSGVVSSRRNDSIEVALDRWPDGKVFRVDLTADEVTRQRYLTAIDTARISKGRLGQMREILLGERKPTFRPTPAEPQALRSRIELNPVQQDCVRFVTSANDFALIHGPPGTGKTTTVVAFICECVADGEKVLACAPSNTAVDNLLERLIGEGIRAVRLGHPARVTESLRQHSLDGLAEHHENAPVVRDMRREAQDLFRKADRWTRGKPARGEKQELRREAKRMLSDAKLLERQAVESILDRADVICATTTFNEEMLGDRWFQTAVVDEACQTPEPGCWVPLLRSDRLILAGDPFQLPPTVLASEAVEKGYSISMLERLMNLCGDATTRLLTRQYRMHENIMRFSSDHFYDGKLVADDHVAAHRLCDLPGIDATEETETPVEFFDSAGAGWEETIEPEGLSKLNEKEADFVVFKVRQLVAQGVAVEDIAVIAPYAAQVRRLRSLFRNLKSESGEVSDLANIEVDTVDGFQGREKEVVVISLVRSNSQCEIGFLKDYRRTNVALTRARRKLIVLGDSATLGSDEFYGSLFQYFESINAYRSVFEELTLMDSFAP